MAAAGGLGWVGAHRGWAAAEAMARVGSGSEEVASSRPQEQGAEVAAAVAVEEAAAKAGAKEKAEEAAMAAAKAVGGELEAAADTRRRAPAAAAAAEKEAVARALASQAKEAGAGWALDLVAGSAADAEAAMRVDRAEEVGGAAIEVAAPAGEFWEALEEAQAAHREERVAEAEKVVAEG